MLIDWFTVGAQALNFILLVWLLKRFLYRPILNALDAREKRIAGELAVADASKAASQQELAEYRRKNEQFEQQRAALMGQVTHEASIERGRLADEARTAADALANSRRKALRDEVLNLSQVIGTRTQQEVFAIARKTLADLATTSLEERMAEVFTARLSMMDSKEKEVLALTLKAASDPALVRSAFELPATQRSAIHDALKAFCVDVRVRFEAAPDLVCGIELTANGQKLGWSIAAYLASLEVSIAALIPATE